MPPPSTLRLGLVQMAVAQGDCLSNTRRALALAARAADAGAQLICLPETCNTGYMHRAPQFQELAQPVDGAFVRALQEVARHKAVHIIAGYCERCEIPGRIYNSAVFVGSGGQIWGNVRKVYLWGAEKSKFRSGGSFPVFDTPLGRIGILICYDIEYPEPARILGLRGAELAVVPSVWSVNAARRWDVQLAANALFNQMYVAGVNQVGENICGKSQVFSPGGECLASASADQEEIVLCDIQLGEVAKARAALPYLEHVKEYRFNSQ